jgi:phospholipase D1/2
MPVRKAARIAAALLVLLAVWFAVHRLPVLRLIVAGAKALHGMGWPGALLTALAIYLLTLLLFPIIPLIVAAGWLYGTWGGALISLAAVVASAATAFAAARALGSGAAAQALLTRPRARALAELAAEGGIVTVALVRLSPILPFTPSNAVMGLTTMRLRDVVLGTALGMTPGVLLYCWAGSLLPSAEAIEQGEPVHGAVGWILLAVALAAAAVLGTTATRRLKRRAEGR